MALPKITAQIHIVQSVYESDIREINSLEQKIVKSEDDADAKLWEQARQVAALLETGISQRQLAKQWINARTGEPYSHLHVNRVVRAFNCYASVTPCPRFRDAYNQVAHPEPATTVDAKFDFGAALDKLHTTLIAVYDASSEYERKRLISNLRSFLTTIETRTYK